MYLIHLKVTNLCRLVLHFDLEILKEECFTYNYTKFQLLLGAPLRDLPIHLPTTYIVLNAVPPMNFNVSFFLFFSQILLPADQCAGEEIRKLPLCYAAPSPPARPFLVKVVPPLPLPFQLILL